MFKPTIMHLINLSTLSFCLFFFSTFAYSQTITGTVHNENNEPFAYATVTFYSTDSTMFFGAAISDTTGAYTFEAKFDTTLVLITASYVGMKSVSRVVDIETHPTQNITIPSTSTTLSTIQVTARIPLLKQNVDRLTMNVSSYYKNTQVRMLDLLSTIPGMMVNPNGDISFAGKTSIQVRRNGRIVRLSGSDLVNYLKGLNSQGLETIDIISNPSSKYEASGTSAILDLNYSKSTYQGLKGSVSGYYRNGYVENSGGSTYLNYNRKKLNITLFTSINNDDEREQFNSERMFTFPNQLIKEDGELYNDKLVKLVSSGIDYAFSDRFSAGLAADYFESKQQVANTSLSVLTSLIIEDYNTNNVTQDDNSAKRFSYNAHAKWIIDTLNSSIRLSADYFDSSTDINVLASSNQERGDLTTITSLTSALQEFSLTTAQLDITKNFSSGVIMEMGGKIALASSDDDFDLEYRNSNGFDSMQINSFTYDEDVIAGYAQLMKKFKNGLMVQVGLRGESTELAGRSLDNGLLFNRKYFNLFPSAFLTKPIGKDNINVSYSRRINRPKYYLLNPFEYFVTPFSARKGNAFLQPSYGHSLDFTYAIRNKYRILGSIFVEDDTFSPYVIQGDENTSVTTYDNIATYKSFKLGLSVPYSIGKWLNANVYADYRIYRFCGGGQIIDQNFENTVGTFAFNTSQRIKITDNFSSRLFLLIVSPSATGAQQLNIRRKFSISFAHKIFNDKGYVNMNFYDPLNWERETLNIDSETLNFTSRNRYLQRGIQVTIGYNFQAGRQMRGARFRNSNREEKSRLQ